MAPPDDPNKEQRRHPRVEFYATVELKAADEMLILSVRNISLGGVFLSADGQDVSKISTGSELALVVFNGADERDQVAVAARVVRKEAAGIALTWIVEDSIFKIASLIG